MNPDPSLAILMLSCKNLVLPKSASLTRAPCNPALRTSFEALVRVVFYFFCLVGEAPPATDMVVEPAEMPLNPTASNASSQLATALEEERQGHLQQIELLQQKLQEQQRINAQQQQQLQQHQQGPGMPAVSIMHGVPSEELQHAFEAPQHSQMPVRVASEVSSDAQVGGASQQQQPKFQLQPEVFAQIQALTGKD